MSKKYYAVRTGRKPGIYHTWDEAKEQVHGYPNAIYRSFKDLSEAQKFIVHTTDKQATKKKMPAHKNTDGAEDESILDADTVIAYVDGSYEKATNRYSFGAVLLQNNQVLTTLSRVGDNPKYQNSWQIAGEVFGALHAIQWAIQHNFKKIIIHYDYLGIERWALGEWRTNKPVSIDYAEAYQKLASQIEVEFVKVKAHSGIEFNEMVDQIAKDAFKNTQ